MWYRMVQTSIAPNTTSKRGMVEESTPLISGNLGRVQSFGFTTSRRAMFTCYWSPSPSLCFWMQGKNAGTSAIVATYIQTDVRDIMQPAPQQSWQFRARLGCQFLSVCGGKPWTPCDSLGHKGVIKYAIFGCRAHTHIYIYIRERERQRERERDSSNYHFNLSLVLLHGLHCLPDKKCADLSVSEKSVCQECQSSKNCGCCHASFVVTL